MRSSRLLRCSNIFVDSADVIVKSCEELNGDLDCREPVGIGSIGVRLQHRGPVAIAATSS